MIINGDSLIEMRKMADKCVDLIVTDPPYNMAYSGRGKVNAFDGFENDNIDEVQHNKWFDEILSECHRVLKDDTAIYIFIDFRNYARIYNLVRKYFVIKNCIVWDKQSIGMGMYYRFQHEFIIYAHKGQPELYLKRNFPDIWRIKRDVSAEYDHPTQKPVEIMAYPIEHSSKVGDLVLDPFVGSGTCCVAAKDLNRQYIGIELEEKYVEIANKRLIFKQEKLL